MIQIQVPERGCEHAIMRAKQFGQSYLVWFGPFRPMIVANHAEQLKYTMQSGLG